MKNFKVFIPTKLLFGAGALSELHEQALPGSKALLVTSAGKSVKKFGYLDRVVDEMKKADVECVVFDKILSNPILEHVQEGAELAVSEGCDFVIGLGGGSSIDSAKSIALLATNGGNYWDCMEKGSGKSRKVEKKPLPIIAITTTAGTGTEVNPWTVISNRTLDEKICFGTDDTYPTIAVVDPELMTSVPPKFTAYQGFDALFHSTECYISKAASAYSEMLNLEAIRVISRSLAAAVKNGNDIEARADVALGNTLSGMSDSISSGISAHSLAHSMGGLNPNLPHGASLIMICEDYYKFYVEKHACDEKMIRMAKAMGNENATEPMDFVKALHDLKVACDVNDLKMSDYGIDPDKFDLYVKHAREDSSDLYEFDPCEFTDDDAMRVMKASYK